MIENYFEEITGLERNKNILKYNGDCCGTFVTEDYDNPNNYFKEFIEVEKLPSEIINQLSKKNYFLIFKRSKNCCI